MKIKEDELKTLIREAVKKKIATLKEGSSDFTAKRQIVHSAQSASMEFEKEIKSLLNLVDPDEMQPQLQERYFVIVEKMKAQVVQAVADAVRELQPLPRNDQQGPGGQ